MDTATDTTKQSVPNRYSLVVLAAKRAKQIREGAPLLIDTESVNSLTIALEEIAAGKITTIEAVDVPAPAPAIIIASAPPPPSAMEMLDASLAEAEQAARPGAMEALADESDHESDADGEQADAEAELDGYAGATTLVAAED